MVIAALVSGAAILFHRCASDIEKIKAFSSSENLPVVHAINFETTFTDSGMVRFYLKTPEIKRFESNGESFAEFPKGIFLQKFNQNNEVASTITARYAKQFVKEQKWEAKNDVVATNSLGDTLKTEHLIWDERNGRIFSEDFVKVIRTDQIITGIGFESDQMLENWRIKNPRGTIYIQLNREGIPPADSVFGNSPLLQPVNVQTP